MFQSRFGNTERVGRAIAEGLDQARMMMTAVYEVSAAPQDLPPFVDLLVVGAPTHGFWLDGELLRATTWGQSLAAHVGDVAL